MRYVIYFLGLLLVQSSWANQAVSVSYTINHQQITVQGVSTVDGYVFNQGATKQVSLATLDWPPYIGEALCDKGWVFRFAVALLTYQGYQVNIQFYPWARAVKLVEQGKIDILFPEYFIEPNAPSDVYKGHKRLDYLALSRPFAGGNIALIKRKGEKDKFKGQLANLVGETIGVVRGYQNTPEFDAMMDAGKFTIIEAVNDFQLVKLLHAKRVNLIIGDPVVLRSTVELSNMPTPFKQLILDEMTTLHPVLQYNFLYFALSKKNPYWQLLLSDINQAIDEFGRLGASEQILGQTTCN